MGGVLLGVALLALLTGVVGRFVRVDLVPLAARRGCGVARTLGATVCGWDWRGMCGLDLTSGMDVTSTAELSRGLPGQAHNLVTSARCSPEAARPLSFNSGTEKRHER